MELQAMGAITDVHVCGQAVRVFEGGVPSIPGETMEEKRNFFAKKLGYLRRRLLHEPRCGLMWRGAILTPPMSEGAAAGILFLESYDAPIFDGYGVIAVAKALFEQQVLPVKEPTTQLILDTAAGPVPVGIEVEHGRAREISIVTPACFAQVQGTKVSVPTLGNVSTDVVYCSRWCALVDADEWRLKMVLGGIRKLQLTGTFVHFMVNKEIMTGVPPAPIDGRVSCVVYHGKADKQGASERLFAVLGANRYEAAPSITGLCGRVTTLFAQGKLAKGEWFPVEGIIGTTLAGRVAEVTKVGEKPSVRVEVKGSAHVIGLGRWIIERDDPLAEGFLVDPPEELQF